MPQTESRPAKSLASRPVIVLALAALLLGLWAGYQFSRQKSTPPPQISATLMPQPKPLQPVRLLDHNNQPFGLERLRGQWTFLFFGYTHCPDVCPSALIDFRNVHKQLQDHPAVLNNTRFTLVSVDPGRDTPAHLRDYMQYYHPDFVGVTGEEQEIKRLARQAGAFYMVNASEGTQDYLIDHSASILLVDPQARIYSIFSPPHQAATITTDYLSIRTYYEENTP